MNLAELVQSARGDRSYEDLARSADSPSRQRWHQLVGKKPINFPDTDTIRQVARVLGVSERAVVLACAESVGLNVAQPLSRLEQLLPANLDRLDRDEESAVLGVIRVLVNRKVGEGRAEQPAANTTARVTGRQDGMTAERWDRAAAALRASDPLRIWSDEELAEMLGGPRPGEVDRAVTGDVAGEGGSTRRGRRQA